MSEVEGLASRLRRDPQRILRQGTVKAIASDGTSLSVSWADEPDPTPSQRFLTSYTPQVGDDVWGIRDAHDGLVLGTRNGGEPGVSRLIAYSILDRATPLQPYQASGSYAGSFTVTTTDQGTGLWLANVPTPPRHLVKVSFHIAAAGLAAFDATNEWYFTVKVAKNGSTTYTSVGEVRANPSGVNSPSPTGFVLYESPADTQTLTYAVDVRVLKNTGTLYRFVGSPTPAHSRLLVEDLGSI